MLPLPQRQAHNPNSPTRALLTIYFSEPLEKTAQFPWVLSRKGTSLLQLVAYLHEVETACLRISSPEDSTIKPEKGVLLTSLEPLDPAIPCLGSQLPETIMNALFCLRQHRLGFHHLTEEARSTGEITRWLAFLFHLHNAGEKVRWHLGLGAGIRMSHKNRVQQVYHLPMFAMRKLLLNLPESPSVHRITFNWEIKTS